MTMKQLQSTMESIRSVCEPKYKGDTAKIDVIKTGQFFEEKAVKCYVLCVVQMAGTVSIAFGAFDLNTIFCKLNFLLQMTKKNELSLQKALSQVDIMLPVDMREPARAAIEQCKDVRKYLNTTRG